MLVYSYMRFSDPRQAAGSSAERQAAYAARWAAEHGATLDESLTLRDEGLSAYHQQHVKSGALGVFLAAIEQGRIVPGSVLVVEGLDRLSRAEPLQAQAQLAQIINAGISVVTASDGREYSRESLKAQPMDLVYSLLVMIRAHEESETKSKRVKAAIRRQCEGWMAGTFRGVIRQGQDPLWLRWAGHAWEMIPERVAAVRMGLELYQRGYSASRIIRELAEHGLALSPRGPQALQIYRLIQQRALLGEREITLDGQTWHLPGYYPALLSQAEWDDLQSIASDRGRRAGRGAVQPVLTGMRLTVCGYCGAALVGQNQRRRHLADDELIPDGHRRLHCTNAGRGGCAVDGSVSVAPIERGIFAYCSDAFNLARLYGADRTKVPKEKLAAAREALAKLDQQLARLTDAMLESDDVPAVFTARARQLEDRRPDLVEAVVHAERDLAAVARSDLTGAHERWRELAAGVEAQEAEARIQARQLVADTFEAIAVYHHGIQPVAGSSAPIDVVLRTKGGAGRLLRLTRKGELLLDEDVHV